MIELPNSYAELSPDRRTVVLKIHGQVDTSPDRDVESFVVSEDDYIDYLASTDIANVVPVTVAARLRRSHFLFLGYALAGWSFRVFLHRVWRDERVRYRSWAVHPASTALEREFWRQRGIDVLDVPLEEYLEGCWRDSTAPRRGGMTRGARAQASPSRTVRSAASRRSATPSSTRCSSSGASARRR